MVFDDRTVVYRVKGREIKSTTILSVFLLTAPFLRDDIVEGVSEFLKIPVQDLFKLVEKVMSMSSIDDMELKFHRQRRNISFARYAYLCRKISRSQLSEDEKRIIGKCIENQRSHINQITMMQMIPHKVIADVLQVDYNRVRSLIHRGKKYLAGMISDTTEQIPKK